MSPNCDGPSWIEDRHMLGPNRKIALCAAQATRPEINRTAGRLGLRRCQIPDLDARCATYVNSDQQILFLIEGIGIDEHIQGVGPIAQLSDCITTHMSAIP